MWAGPVDIRNKTSRLSSGWRPAAHDAMRWNIVKVINRVHEASYTSYHQTPLPHTINLTKVCSLARVMEEVSSRSWERPPGKGLTGPAGLRYTVLRRIMKGKMTTESLSASRMGLPIYIVPLPLP